MTTSEILKAYEEISFLSGLNIFWIAFITFIIAISFFIWQNKFEFHVMIILSLCVVGLSIVQSLLINIDVEKKRLNQWEETTRNEYVDKLEVTRLDVDKYIVGDTKNTDTEYLFNPYKKRPETIKPVEVRGKDDGVPYVLSLNAAVVEVDDIKEAYLEYQYVDKEIPLFDKEYYNATLYLPKSK
jgi:hypothetical protein